MVPDIARVRNRVRYEIENEFEESWVCQDCRRSKSEQRVGHGQHHPTARGRGLTRCRGGRRSEPLLSGDAVYCIVTRYAARE